MDEEKIVLDFKDLKSFNISFLKKEINFQNETGLKISLNMHSGEMNICLEEFKSSFDNMNKLSQYLDIFNKIYQKFNPYLEENDLFDISLDFLSGYVNAEDKLEKVETLSSSPGSKILLKNIKDFFNENYVVKKRFS